MPSADFPVFIAGRACPQGSRDMKRSTPTTISGVNLHPKERCAIYRVGRVSDNAELVVSSHETSLLPRGAGKAYGDCALNEGRGVLLQEGLDRLIAFDPGTRELVCEAGVTLQRIIEVFMPKGFFLAVTPGTCLVTLGGCIAADVHGKNHHCGGSFYESVVWFDLLTAGGEVQRCSRDQNERLFNATLGGLGLTGIILRACIRLQPIESRFVSVQYKQAGGLDELLDLLARGDESTYSVAWIDCLARGRKFGRGVVMLGEHAGIEALPLARQSEPFLGRSPRRLSVPCHAPSRLLNPLTVGAFNRLYYWLHKTRCAVEDFNTFFYPLDAMRNWSRLYGRGGFVQHQSLIPSAAGAGPIKALLEKVVGSRRASFLAVLKRMGPGNDGLLSFPRDGLTLALDLGRPDASLLALTDEMDRITADAGGRVYLAKNASLAPDLLEQMYPRLDEFKALREEIDPKGRFDSSLSRRLGLGRNAV